MNDSQRDVGACLQAIGYGIPSPASRLLQPDVHQQRSEESSWFSVALSRANLLLDSSLRSE
jgi:hypothetical protein